jgi:hypothetical protein
MAKPITVYWASWENVWMRASKPELVSKRFFSKGFKDTDVKSSMSVNFCPAVNKYFKNLYAVKSVYDYSFTVENDKCFSKLYDQQFFDNHVIVRSIEKRVFSFLNRYVFFTDEKSLEITAVLHPTFEENAISERCMPIPGSFDIGKWFRPLEFPFILKKEFDTFAVNDQDVMYYLRFHTDRPIILKQFFINDSLEKFINGTVSITSNKLSKLGTFNDIYALFKPKKLILKEINQNLL